MDDIPKLTSGLKILDLYKNDNQDEAMDRILNWAAEYSEDSLARLWIHENDVTKIPRQFQTHFPPKLKELKISSQKSGISSIPTGSFYGISPDYNLNAENNQIATIDDGAFQGTGTLLEIYFLNFVFF